MAAPGTAYDDPVLGRDPQPSHMRDHVDTVEDNGGVHINSGILNHAFYRAAMAIGGKTWHGSDIVQPSNGSIGRAWWPNSRPSSRSAPRATKSTAPLRDL